MIFNRLNVLTEEEIDRIIEGAHRILKNAGTRFEYPKALDTLAAMGCDVDSSSMVVKFPSNVIEEALKNVPSLIDPDDRPKLFVPGSCKGMILDYPAMTMRPGATDDIDRIIKLMNALENITVASAGVVPSDVHPGAADVVATEKLFRYSEKLFTQWVYTPASGRSVIEMAKVVTGGEEELKGSGIINYYMCPITPLRFPSDPLELADIYAAYDLPIIIGPMPQAGSTAPATPAGALVLLTAEFLAGIVYGKETRIRLHRGESTRTQLTGRCEAAASGSGCGFVRSPSAPASVSGA